MNNYIHKIKKILRHPEYLLYFLVPKLLSDRVFLKIQYRFMTGQRLDLKKPVLFNEKLQWLKLHDRQPHYSDLVDKYEVRKYIAKTIGEEYLIPLLGVWDSFDEIPFDSLPNEFVLKCTHDSGGIMICHDKKYFDLSMARNFFDKRLSKNYFWNFREYAYKYIRPRIIAEKLMVDESGVELKDYKMFCFNGEPKIIQVDFGRFTEHKRNFYDLSWGYQNFALLYPTDPNVTITEPDCLVLMLELARKLSAGKMHMRVDFYVIEGKTYFGELTFYHEAGYGKFDPPEWNKTFGDWLILPEHKTLTEVSWRR